MFENDLLVWPVEDEDRRLLCPLSSPGNAHHVDESEKRHRPGDDSALASRRLVPFSDALGKTEFPHAATLK